MTNEYELAGDNRADLIYDKDALLAPMEPDMVPPPHAMAPGCTADDYYRGTVTGTEGAVETDSGPVR